MRMTKVAPGFLAERSIYGTIGHYNAHLRERRSGAVIAALIDPGCFNACYNHCNWDCFELVGSARGACLQECKEVEVICRASCPIPSCVPWTTCHQDPSTANPD